MHTRHFSINLESNMSKQVYKNAKYANWMQDYTFDNCKLDRKKYGEFLASYLAGERDGFVLNLNGAWGTGKTEFLKRLYTHLKTLKHPVIYIDAWESDFSKDPLTVVASELLNQLEGLNNGIGNSSSMKALKNHVGRALKSTAIAAAGVVSKQLIGDASIGIESTKKLIEGDQGNYIDELKDHYANQVEAISLIREKLSSLAEVLQQNYDATLPVIVLVDELDRCRPNYAIEMLEVIKHFFATKNFVFVIGSDTQQLSCSIKAIYGNDFDSQQYLKRFFDRQAALPLPNLLDYVRTKNLDYVNLNSIHLFPRYGLNSGGGDEVQKVVADMAKAYDLKIRDIDQLWAKLKSCLIQIQSTNASGNIDNHVNIIALVVGLIEQDKNFSEFRDRKQGHRVHKTPDNNFTIFKDMKVNEVIKYSLDCVVKVLESIEGSHGRVYEEYCLPNNDYFVDILPSGGNAEARNFVHDLKYGVGYNDRAGVKYWLWEDLKQVIQLSGNIK